MNLCFVWRFVFKEVRKTRFADRTADANLTILKCRWDITHGLGFELPIAGARLGTDSTTAGNLELVLARPENGAVRPLDRGLQPVPTGRLTDDVEHAFRHRASIQLTGGEVVLDNFAFGVEELNNFLSIQGEGRAAFVKHRNRNLNTLIQFNEASFGHDIAGDLDLFAALAYPNRLLARPKLALLPFHVCADPIGARFGRLE